MPLQCNIDARGKRIRLIMGVVEVLLSIALLFAWALPSGSGLAWGLTVALFVFGAFAIFEARAGWCVIRAMGMKTRF